MHRRRPRSLARRHRRDGPSTRHRLHHRDGNAHDPHLDHGARARDPRRRRGPTRDRRESRSRAGDPTSSSTASAATVVVRPSDRRSRRSGEGAPLTVHRGGLTPARLQRASRDRRPLTKDGRRIVSLRANVRLPRRGRSLARDRRRRRDRPLPHRVPLHRSRATPPTEDEAVRDLQERSSRRRGRTR